MILHCKNCGKEFRRRTNRGPVPLYCKTSCRQRAYEKRKHARHELDWLAKFAASNSKPWTVPRGLL